MSQESVPLSQIEVDVAGAFTTHHRFRTQTGEGGELVFPAFGRGASFTGADGRRLSLNRKSPLGSKHELVEGRTVRATAEGRGLFSHDIIIHFDDQDYTLTPEGPFSRSWYLNDASGTRVLEIRPRGVFRRGAYLLPESDLAPDLIVFAYYLVYVRQQEEAAAGAATAS